MKKSKKLLSLLVSLSIIFGAIGCNPDTQANTKTQIKTEQKSQTEQTNSKKEVKIPKQNNNLTEEKVFEQLKKSVQNLKSVTASYKVTVSKLDENGKETGDKNNVDIYTKVLYSSEKDKDKYTKISQMFDKTNIDGVKSQAFVDIKNNKIYLDNDGKGLKEYKGKDLTPQTESAYTPMIKSILLSKTLPKEKQFKFIETEKTYELTFKGKNNGDLLYMIDGLFGLGMELMNLDNVEMDVKYEISKADFSVIKITHTLYQTVEGEKYKSIGIFELLGINDIKSIEEAKNIK